MLLPSVRIIISLTCNSRAVFLPERSSPSPGFSHCVFNSSSIHLCSSRYRRIYPSIVCCKATKNLYFGQETKYSQADITYHYILKRPCTTLWKRGCKSFPAFHVPTGSDFTQPFYERS